MSEHGIIFSAPMVRAIGKRLKTQTRRLDNGRQPYRIGDVLWVRETWQLFDPHVDCPVPIPPERLGKRAPYQGCEGDRPIYWTAVYRADGEIVHPKDGPARWRSPIHMFRWASRYTLVVTDVRRQQLQEISEEDARAEGVSEGLIPASGDHPTLVGYVFGDDDGKCALYPTARQAFAIGWDGINGDRQSVSGGAATWHANPAVYAYTFKVIHGR